MYEWFDRVGFVGIVPTRKRIPTHHSSLLTVRWQRDFVNIRRALLRWRSPKTGYWLVPAAEKAGIGRIGWHAFRHYSACLTITR